MNDLETVIATLVSCGIDVCDTCPYHEHFDGWYTHECKLAKEGGDFVEVPVSVLADAIVLLKAQEAVEPTRYDSTLYLCSSCHYAISRVVNYCPNCGKRVKWE